MTRVWLAIEIEERVGLSGMPIQLKRGSRVDAMVGWITRGTWEEAFKTACEEIEEAREWIHNIGP